MTLTDVEFSGNSAHADGGGLWNSGKVDGAGAKFNGNSAGIDGGGIFSSGMVTMTNSTFSGNSAGTDGGGAIDNLQGIVDLTGVTLNGNSAVTGGALDNFFGTMALTNSTLKGNSAETDGGGLYNDHGATFLFSVTFSDNAAARHGGALYHIDHAIDQETTLKNTIVADSVSGANCFTDPKSLTGIISHGFNLSSDASCPFVDLTDWNNAAAHLGPLANNGGPTLTQIAFPPSKAVDGGSDCRAADQRGVARPQGQACDIGAVEYQAGELSPWLYLPSIYGETS